MVNDELTGLLADARRAVPFYQDRIPEPPFDLTRVPILTRPEIRVAAARLWSTEGDPRTWKRIRTTGTTGEPLSVVLDPSAQRQELGELAELLDRTLGPETAWDERDVLHLTLHRSASSVAVPSPWYPGAVLAKWNLSRLWQLPDADFRAALSRLDGQVVTAMPSVLALLLDRLRGIGGPAPSPLAVVLSGETVGPEIRQAAAAGLTTRVLATYTLAEAGTAATSCPETGGYHPTGSVAVEVVDGDILVTPLLNRAMPLIRYRTGDRGEWAEPGCGCGEPLLRLTSTRPGNVTIGIAGRPVNRVEFEKLTAALEVDAVRVTGGDDGAVVEYAAAGPLPAAEGAVLVAAVRRVLGRPVPVRLHRLDSLDETAPVVPRPFQPPAVLATDEVSGWLRERLAEVPGVLWASLTGSSLDPAVTSRFSDIDLTVLVAADPSAPRWRSLARQLHEGLPTLRVNVTTAADLADSPLIAARLCAERRVVLGADCPIDFPAPEAAAAEARMWAQNARAVLWTRITDPNPPGADVLREAWMATKFAVDALRYQALRTGGRETGAARVLDEAQHWGVPGLPAVRAAAEVAREHRPPPADVAAGRRYLEAALGVVDWLITGLRAA